MLKYYYFTNLCNLFLFNPNEIDDFLVKLPLWIPIITYCSFNITDLLTWLNTKLSQQSAFELINSFHEANNPCEFKTLLKLLF